MAKNKKEIKVRKEYVAPNFKKIVIEELKNAWDFEVFGLCAPTMAIGGCCA